MGECGRDEGPDPAFFPVAEADGEIFCQYTEEFAVFLDGGVLPCGEDGGVDGDDGEDFSASRVERGVRVRSASYTECAAEDRSLEYGRVRGVERPAREESDWHVSGSARWR